MSHDDPSKKTEATPKYQQIVVPDHALKPNTSGTSFLRTGTFPSLTDTTKQPPGFRKSLELARLAGDHHLKTGGSWHHVDGNRIETTTGRKVEIIEGSYIAHRGPGNSPGPNFSSTWATTSYTQIGSSDLPIGPQPAPSSTSTPNDPDSNFADTLSFPFGDGSGFTFSPLPVPPGTPPGTPQPPTSDIDVIPTGSTTSANGALTSGDVASVTWAQRTLTYIGSPSKPVGLAFAETQAGTIKQRNFAQTGDVVSWNHAPFGKFWQDSLATTILTTNEAKADITVTNTAPNLFTNNLGTQEVLNLGPAMATLTAAPAVATLTAAADVATLTAALKVATVTTAAAILTINVGAQTTVSVPEDTTIKNITNRINITQQMIQDAENSLTATMKSGIHTLENRISETETWISENATAVGTMRVALWLMHLLGS